MALSFPMIGVVRKQACRAEQLLGEHGAGEEVGPGRLAEGEQEVCFSSFCFAEAVRAAEQEARLPFATVAPGLQPLREGDRAQLLALLVEQDGDAIVGWRG